MSLRGAFDAVQVRNRLIVLEIASPYRLAMTWL